MRPDRIIDRDTPIAKPEQIIVDLQILVDLFPLQKPAIDAIVAAKLDRRP